MGKPAINAGSSALQAYMQGVANMGQVRAQMQQNTTNAINALGDTFSKWQDDFNKRKHLKWTQQMEEAKLAETQRVNDSNIKVNEGNLALNQAAQPFIDNLRKAQAANARADAAATNEATSQSRKIFNYGEKNMMADMVKGKYGLNGKKDDTSAAPNSSSTGTTGNGTTLTGTPQTPPVKTPPTDNPASPKGISNGYNNYLAALGKNKG